jgi:hypothetical protein
MASARCPSAIDRARDAQRRVEARVVQSLVAMSALVYVYDVILLSTA